MNVCDEASGDAARGGSSRGGGGGGGSASWKEEGSAELVTKEGELSIPPALPLRWGLRRSKRWVRSPEHISGMSHGRIQRQIIHICTHTSAQFKIISVHVPALPQEKSSAEWSLKSTPTWPIAGFQSCGYDATHWWCKFRRRAQSRNGESKEETVQENPYCSDFEEVKTPVLP